MWKRKHSRGTVVAFGKRELPAGALTESEEDRLFQTEFARRRKQQATSPSSSASMRVDIAGVVPLVWEEHCTECAFPTCYETCKLYRARRDGHCARFDDGIAAVRSPAALGGYAADLTFGRWAKLEATLPRAVVRVAPPMARSAARLDHSAARGLALVPESQAKRVHQRFADIRTRSFQRLGRAAVALPDALVVELWSYHETPFRLFVETVAANDRTRTSIAIEPGSNSSVVPASELGITQDRWPDRILIYPEDDLPVHLEISSLELAWFSSSRTTVGQGSGPEVPGAGGVAPGAGPQATIAAPAELVKVLVWDLDNTLWHGTLVDDGPDGVVLREGVRDLLTSLDQRGILLSIASKNDEGPALEVLQRFGISDLFLAPEIHWGPKSGSIRRIGRSLNLGLDSFAFVDDSAFERGEVATALGAIRLFEPDDLPGLLARPEFDVAVTQEAQGRRAMYRVEADRRRELDAVEGDYDSFLRSCELTLRVFTPTTPEEIERCVELVHRTNQLNLTTRRISGDEFQALLDDSSVEVFGLAAADRFGSYGIIGVAIVDSRDAAPVLTDFLTSCRVAQKSVENAWFEWLRGHLAASGWSELHAVFISTDRNHLLRSVLDEVGFVERPGGSGGDPLASPGQRAVPLLLPLDREVPRSSYVAVSGPKPVNPAQDA